MAKVQLHHDSDVEKTLARDDVEAFGYTLNPLGFGMFLMFGGTLLSAAGYIYFKYAFTQPMFTAIMVGLAGAGLVIGINAARWYAFQRTHFVAVSPDKLYVGEEERMWSIDWEVLDAEALGFDSLDVSQLRGSMEIEAGGQKIDLQLYNAYCYLDDIQGFMLEMLSQLKAHQHDDDDAAPADDDARPEDDSDM
ncbi:MAG: hypothetical protein ACQEVA_05120 [Myxococcota bacterium]